MVDQTLILYSVFQFSMALFCKEKEEISSSAEKLYAIFKANEHHIGNLCLKFWIMKKIITVNLQTQPCIKSFGSGIGSENNRCGLISSLIPTFKDTGHYW